MALSAPPRLLIVDADESGRTMAAGVATAAGVAEVAFAPDSKRAFALLKAGGADFVLADFDTLEAESFVLTKAMRHDEALAGVPLLVGVATTEQERIRAAVLAGARNFIAKPFEAEALATKIECLQVAADPADLEARKHFARGFAFLKSRKHYQATAEFAKALKLKRNFPEAIKGLAEAKLGMGDHAGSNALLGKAAESYALLDRDGEALRLYEELKRQNPATANPFQTAARRHKAEGRLDKAIERFEKAVSAAPQDADVACELSETYQEVGDEEKAVQTITDALERTGGGGSSVKAQIHFLNLTGTSWKDYCIDKEKQKKVTVIEDEGPPEEPKYNEHRKAARIPLADYVMLVPRRADPLHVVNISMGGIAFKTEEDTPAVGQVLTFDLGSQEAVKIKKLQVVIRHSTRGVSGGSFVDLNPKQKKLLEKILINEKPEGYVLDTEVNFDIPMM
ncbi:MAG: tetratricopeptide repeat protein [Desulfovibrionaceae bacterium]|jgi:tetratricopeptide (TPR) repeat protein|nr:tetratricopeptide repeat protein [Desulfovibrionaceae bacterium]